MARRIGRHSRRRFPRLRDDSLESDLERGWEASRGTSRMAWNEAKGTVKDAWHGAERIIPGDFDRDGR